VSPVQLWIACTISRRLSATHNSSVARQLEKFAGSKADECPVTSAWSVVGRTAPASGQHERKAPQLSRVLKLLGDRISLIEFT
jgi:hypothetical protein